jgi:hypothetical protein
VVRPETSPHIPFAVFVPLAEGLSLTNSFDIEGDFYLVTDQYAT